MYVVSQVISDFSDWALKNALTAVICRETYLWVWKHRWGVSASGCARQRVCAMVGDGAGQDLHLSSRASTSSLFGFAFGFLSGVLGSKSFVLFSDFVELLHVLEEVWTSLERDEELGLLTISVSSRALHCDGPRSDLLESGVVVSTQYSHQLWSILT